MKRRTFLGTAAAGSVALLAGCQDDPEEIIEQEREEMEDDEDDEDDS